MQFILEHVISLTFVLVMIVILFFNIGNITDMIVRVVLGLMFLTLLATVVFWVLKRQSKWFKHKDYVPKVINFVVIFATGLIVSSAGRLQIDRWFVFIPVVVLVFMSCVNYYLNFRETEPSSQ